MAFSGERKLSCSPLWPFPYNATTSESLPVVVEVTLQILRQFRDEVEEQGGRFYVIHLPKKSDLQRLQNGRPLAYEQLWQRVRQDQRTIDPTPCFLREADRAGLETLFAAPKGAHYSDAAIRLLADVIVSSLQGLR